MNYSFDPEKEHARLVEKMSSSEDIFDGIVLHVKRDTVTLSNGKSAIREVIRHIGAVCVIPVTKNNEVIIRAYTRFVEYERKKAAAPYEIQDPTLLHTEENKA